MARIRSDSDRRAMGVSRRRMLQAAAAAGAGLPLAQELGGGGPLFAQSRPAQLPFYTPRPEFSLEERNRRWAAVRANMAKPQWNLDAIVTVGSDGLGNNARYLTQIFISKYSQAAPEVLFPRDPAKPVVAHISGARHVTEWTRRLAPNGWLSDGKLELRAASGPKALADLLRASGFCAPCSRIGVAKLKGSRFDPDGLVSHTWFEALRAELPGAVFVPIDQFTPQVGNDVGPIEDASMAKSEEERAALRRAVAANERGIAAAIAAARNGATLQSELWWACFQEMWAGTGDDIVRCSIGFDGGGNSTLGDPTDMPVRMGQICNQEISSSCQGYGVQINHAFFIGTPSMPGYGYYRAAIEVLVKVHERALAFIQPGRTTYGDLQAHNEGVFRELGHRGSGTNTHGGGIGFLSRPRQSPDDNRVVMWPGHCFDFKPAVVLDRRKIRDVHEENRSVQLGEAFLVTETGAVRLGTRPLVPIATHA
ncbi:MAG: M24 family metallopeptidase [Acidobacteriota bacterium]